MAKKQITYQSAVNELEEILVAIEENSTEIDMLSEKIKRASELISFCKKKLKSTEKDIEKIVSDLSE